MNLSQRRHRSPSLFAAPHSTHPHPANPPPSSSPLPHQSHHHRNICHVNDALKRISIVMHPQWKYASMHHSHDINSYNSPPSLFQPKPLFTDPSLLRQLLMTAFRPVIQRVLMDIQPAAPSLLRHQRWIQFPIHVFFQILMRFNLSTDTPIHVVLVFLIPPLITLVGIKYQGKTLTPFETHPVTIMISVISLLVYCCLAYVSQQALVSTEACSRFMTFSGSLSLVTLASLLLPEPLRVALYAFYSLVLVLAASYSYGAFDKLYRWVRKIVEEKLVDRFRDQNRLLPLIRRDVN